MASFFRTIAVAGLAGLLFLTVTGCSTGFISEAARSSAANFLSSVFSTAVNEVVMND